MTTREHDTIIDLLARHSFGPFTCTMAHDHLFRDWTGPLSQAPKACQSFYATFGKQERYDYKAVLIWLGY